MLDHLAAELSFWRWVAAHFDEYLERYASANELANLTLFGVHVHIRYLELTMANEQRKAQPPHELHGTPARHPVAAVG